MLRTALCLALLGLALGGVLQGQGMDAKPQSGEVSAGDGRLPSQIDSDDDVRAIFRFLVQNGRDFAQKVRDEIPQADDITSAQDPDAALEQVLAGVGKAFRHGMENNGKVLHSLGVLSEAIFKHQMTFRRIHGGCNELYKLGENFDITDRQAAARAAAKALSDDLYCLANNADVSQDVDSFIDNFKSADITALDALTIVSSTAHELIKGNEDGFLIMEGAKKVLDTIDPTLKDKIVEGMMGRPSHEQQVERLLRTLLKAIDNRK